MYDKINRRQAVKLVSTLALSAAAGSCNSLDQGNTGVKENLTTVEPNNYIRDEDHEFFERELASFVPDRLFDAHSHLWCPAGQQGRLGLAHGAGYKEYRRLIDVFHPGREVASLFIPRTRSLDFAPVHERISQALTEDSSCRGSFFVKPGDDPEWVRQETQRLGLCAFKCYHTKATVKPTWQADIPTFLPEAFVKVANEEGWAITLHMVKSRAVADPGNIHWIRHYCRTYPNMKLILAHSARAFQPAHALEGLDQLTDLDNLYFDTSANPEPIAHQAIIRTFGPKRMLYGSDFPASHLRGRSVAVADTFLWLYEDTPVWKEKHQQIKPVLVGLEVLRSLKWACWSAQLSDSDVEDIFWNNAARLFGIT